MGKIWTVNLGPIEFVPVGQGQCFVLYGQEVAVFRDRAGKLSAIENRCPHRQGPLAEGVMGSGKVVCPLHGHKFDLATGQGNEKQECLRTFPIREQAGQITIEYSFLKPQPFCVGADH